MKKALFSMKKITDSPVSTRKSSLSIGTGSMTKKSSVRSLLFSETDDIL